MSSLARLRFGENWPKKKKHSTLVAAILSQISNFWLTVMEAYIETSHLRSAQAGTRHPLSIPHLAARRDAEHSRKRTLFSADYDRSSLLLSVCFLWFSALRRVWGFRPPKTGLRDGCPPRRHGVFIEMGVSECPLPFGHKGHCASPSIRTRLLGCADAFSTCSFARQFMGFPGWFHHSEPRRRIAYTMQPRPLVVLLKARKSANDPYLTVRTALQSPVL